MQKAHVFQHKFAGVQIFVWHCNSQEEARLKISEVVINISQWVYLGFKTATDSF